MKKKLLFLLFLSPTFFLTAQNTEDKTIYLDSLWNITKEGNHQYYRVIKDYNSEKDFYQITDYYKSGKTKSEGNSIDNNGFSKKGEFVYYYENGNKEYLINYDKQGYIGKYINWYENGNKRLEGEYLIRITGIQSELKINEFWNPQGKQTIVDGNGEYEENDKYYYSKGEIKNGLRDGFWTGKDKTRN